MEITGELVQKLQYILDMQGDLRGRHGLKFLVEFKNEKFVAKISKFYDEMKDSQSRSLEELIPFLEGILFAMNCIGEKS